MIITFYQHYVDAKGVTRVEVGVEEHAKLIDWYLKKLNQTSSPEHPGTMLGIELTLRKFFDSLEDYEKVRTN